jgi:hypothetical protein
MSGEPKYLTAYFAVFAASLTISPSGKQELCYSLYCVGKNLRRVNQGKTDIALAGFTKTGARGGGYSRGFDQL